MKDKIRKYLKEFIVFIVLMTIFANAVSLYRSTNLNKAPLDMEFQIDNNKPTLVYIWGSWCPVCKAESDNIQTISENFNVITIAVKSGNDEDIKKYLQSRNLTYKFINDEDGYLAEKFAVNIYPTIIIYDKNRDVVFSDVGYTSTWGLWLRMYWAGL